MNSHHKTENQESDVAALGLQMKCRDPVINAVVLHHPGLTQFVDFKSFCCLNAELLSVCGWRRISGGERCNRKHFGLWPFLDYIG